MSLSQSQSQRERERETMTYEVVSASVCEFAFCILEGICGRQCEVARERESTPFESMNGLVRCRLS